MSKMIMTFEFGTSKIICAIGRKRSRGRFEIVSFSPVSYAGIKKGKWVSLDSVPAVLKKAVIEAESKIRNTVEEAFVGIPSCFTKVHCSSSSIDLGEGPQVITPDIVDEMMASAENFTVPEEYELIESSPVYFKLDDEKLFIDPIGVEAEYIEGQFSFIFAKKSFLHQVETMLDVLDIGIRAFKPETLCQSLFLIPVEERDSSSVMLDIGYNDTSVTVAYGDTIIFTRMIPVGGAQISSDLSQCLDIDMEAAERLKRRYSFDGASYPKNIKETVRQKDGSLIELDKNMISDIITARAEHLCMLINRVLDSSNIELPNTTKIYLTGAGIAMMKGSVMFLKENLNRNVILPEIEAVNYSTPNYYNSIGLLDYILTNEVI